MEICSGRTKERDSRQQESRIAAFKAYKMNRIVGNGLGRF